MLSHRSLTLLIRFLLSPQEKPQVRFAHANDPAISSPSGYTCPNSLVQKSSGFFHQQQIRKTSINMSKIKIRVCVCV